MKAALAFALALSGVLVVACGSPHRGSGDDTGCTGMCTALGFEACDGNGGYTAPVSCGPDQQCDPAHGCVTCPAGQTYCGGDTANDVYQCNADGTAGTLVMACATDQACSMGVCETPCQAAAEKASNLGCEFYAVDLPNETSDIGPISTDAEASQYSIVVANDNAYPVHVTVTIDLARYGQPIQEKVVLETDASPGVAKRIDLPQREIDGTMKQQGTYVKLSGSGTFVSTHAYHVTTTGPVVIYQFNPIDQEYSNDAATLIPVASLGSEYVMLGFPTANPCSISGLGLPGIPDHTSMTIMATQDDTTVTVHTTHPIHAAGGDSGVMLSEIPKGATFMLHLSRYDVANLSSLQPENVGAGECASAVNGGQDGDFTGSEIHADKPISVFTSGQRADGFGGAPNITYPPDWDMSTDDLCCTDHVEEQLFPVTALGKEFAIARSPIRSTDPTGWIEPDIVRVVGTIDGTDITTNLPSPYDHFTLGANQQKTFASTTGFALSASAAVQINTFTVPQHFVKHGYVGDPTQITIPAAEQFRKQYVFLVPATFENNYMVLARPVGTDTILDGTSLSGIEFGSCSTGPIGTVSGTAYEQLTCKVPAGQHTVSADVPFGLLVYGYYSVSAYGYFGGSDIKVINPIE